jgi:hypothetical protein
MLDAPGIPLYLLLIVFIVIPGGFALLFRWMTFVWGTPLVFRCCRCAREFRQRPSKPFPRCCPACGARDWNLGD